MEPTSFLTQREYYEISPQWYTMTYSKFTNCFLQPIQIGVISKLKGYDNTDIKFFIKHYNMMKRLRAASSLCFE